MQPGKGRIVVKPSQPPASQRGRNTIARPAARRARPRIVRSQSYLIPMRPLPRLATLAGLGALALTLYGRERAWERLAPSDLGAVSFDALVRSPTPNDALAATPLLGMDAEIALPLYAAAPAEVLAAIDARVAAEGDRARTVAAGPLMRRTVTRSALMRFPDTTVIEAVEVPGGTALRAYARASLGRSDLGANAARLRDWLGGLPLPRAATPPARR